MANKLSTMPHSTSSMILMCSIVTDLPNPSRNPKSRLKHPQKSRLKSRRRSLLPLKRQRKFVPTLLKPLPKSLKSRTRLSDVAVETTAVAVVMVADVVITAAVVETPALLAKMKMDLLWRLERSLSQETTADVAVATTVETAEVVVATTAEIEVAREAANEEIVVVETAPRRKELLSLLSNNSNLNNE